jgi:manganese/zinc/iron transport system ATP- binding protein
MRSIHLPYGHRVPADPVPGAPAVEAVALSVRYPGAATPAVHDISLTIREPTLVALVGPNGAGKSTLLKAIAGLLEPAAGALRIFGRPAGACRPQVAYLPQRGEIDWRFPIDVRRLVMTGRYIHRGWVRRPNRDDAALVDDVLARLRLTGLATCQIGRLSGGQQQRTLLARALVQQARLLLLDEPLNAVDADTSDIIISAIARLRRGGTTVVVATHDHDRLAAGWDAVFELPAPGSRLLVCSSERAFQSFPGEEPRTEQPVAWNQERTHELAD